MLLDITWLKAEHERLFNESMDFEKSAWMGMCQAYYNMGLRLGEYTGRLKAIDELIEHLEKQTHEPELSHADANGRTADTCQPK